MIEKQGGFRGCRIWTHEDDILDGLEERLPDETETEGDRASEG